MALRSPAKHAVMPAAPASETAVFAWRIPTDSAAQQIAVPGLLNRRLHVGVAGDHVVKSDAGIGLQEIRQVPLWVAVYAENLVTALCQTFGERCAGGRFSDAALLVCDGDDIRVVPFFLFLDYGLTVFFQVCEGAFILMIERPGVRLCFDLARRFVQV